MVKIDRSRDSPMEGGCAKKPNIVLCVRKLWPGLGLVMGQGKNFCQKNYQSPIICCYSKKDFEEGLIDRIFKMSEKVLVIAEKPSVASDIAKVLGGMSKEKDYFEGEHYVVSSAVGHLLELAVPEKYDVKRGKWTFAHLPMLPPAFDLKPIKKTEDKLKTLKRLLKRSDIVSVINACDAGREGELIFRYIMQASKCKKPIQRLWLQSMTPAAIREAFAHLRSDAQMQNLADAARSRSEADWLVGINGTRAMTAFNSKDGGFYLTTVGRVQTPTLAIVVEREEKISTFKSQKYWEVHADIQAQAGVYEGIWFDPAFVKDEQNPQKKPERIWDQSKAEQICSKINSRKGSVEETAKRTTQLSPLLFDLTSLQREANTRFGFSAKTTLSIAQSLYEKHKVLTYPRTDARALPEDYMPTVRNTMQMLASQGEYARSVQAVLQHQWIRPSKRVFDNTKISDHFAIIPTLQEPKKLSEVEAKIYDMVVKRFLAVFFPAAEYDVTTRITTVEGEKLKTEGKVLVNPGWLAVYGREGQAESSMPKVEKGEIVSVNESSVQEKETKAPPRYTEATLLSAMEGAGKLVDEGELREAMKGKGLGTPATRAAIIEGLLTQKYLRRDGRELRPTYKARQLFALLKGLGVSELSEPELTGEWEYKLAQIEQGKLTREQFMKEIRNMTVDIVESAKRYEGDTVPIENPAHLKSPCPKCGGEIVENYKRFACTRCDFSLPKHPGGRTFEVPEVEELLQNGEIGPLDGFISKMGRPFSAKLRLTADHKLEFDFGNSEQKDDEPLQADQLEPVGRCPKCGSRVLNSPKGYICEKTLEKACDFRIGKTILQQPISVEQVQKLLSEGKSDELSGFVSNRTKRKFEARLTLAKDGKIGFEFSQVRPARKTSSKGTKKS